MLLGGEVADVQLKPDPLVRFPGRDQMEDDKLAEGQPVGVLFGRGAAAAPGARLRHDLRQHGQQVVHLLVSVVGPDGEA